MDDRAWKPYEKDVDSEGLVPDPMGQGIETTYARCEWIGERDDGEVHFLSVVGDDGVTNVEIRVPWDDIVEMIRKSTHGLAPESCPAPPAISPTQG